MYCKYPSNKIPARIDSELNEIHQINYTPETDFECAHVFVDDDINKAGA